MTLPNGLRIAKDILVPQQTLWKISSTSATVSQQPIIQTTIESHVRCRLLSSSVAESLSVVLHLHGGGFVSQSPDSHEIYLRDWAQRLNDAAIVSVDYALSPKNKYPVALQQVLGNWLIT